jgi:oligopeptidase B
MIHGNIEPAKWVAKLRTMKTNDAVLYLDTNMDVGHGGASGSGARKRTLSPSTTFLSRYEQPG